MKKEKTTLTKPQKALLETVIEELKKGVVPWQKPWHALGSPQNAKSGHEYRGENHFYLSLIMMENGFSDPRFLTFAQMLDHNKGLPREEQLSLPKGTTGFPISYASYYSKELKRNLSGADFKIWSQEEIQKKFAEGEIYYFQKTATVFNLEQFEGSFPSLQLEKTDIQVDLDLVKGVAEKMKLSFILEKNGNRAYYSPLKDEVCIPSEESFHEEIGFYTTVFHEFAHATSHPTRLDREIKGRGDLKAYAVEELRAEISSLFLSQKIDLPLSEKDVAQGASYIGNWLEVLENDPQVLFEGAKDAGKISAYLFDHVKSYEVEKNLHLELSSTPKKISDELIVVGYDHSWIYLAKDELDQSKISILEENTFRDSNDVIYPYYEIEKWDDFYELAEKTRMKNLNDGFPEPKSSLEPAPEHDHIAVKVGTEFILADKKKTTGIDLVVAGTIVQVEGVEYPLYKGSTFEESKKVDHLIDSGLFSPYKLNEYEAEEDFDLSL